MHCPSCLSDKIKMVILTMESRTTDGSPLRCKVCGRQFVEQSTHGIPMETRNSIEAALAERLSLRGICRVFKVSLTWL